MSFDDGIKWGTLVVAGFAACFSVASWYIQRDTQSRIELLKSRLGERAETIKYVRDKQLEARDRLLGVMAPLCGAEGMLQRSHYRDEDDVNWDTEAGRLAPIAYDFIDWFRIYRIFLPMSTQTDIEPHIEALRTYSDDTSQSAVHDPWVDRKKVNELWSELFGASDVALKALDRVVTKAISDIIEGPQ
jgi:hypothetical protein